MTIPILQVDAFTASPFAGNPAAVCLLPAPAPAKWMQAVAREMNLSETAFLERRPDGYNLRWFTPAVEVDLCGHATLASAHVLWAEGHMPAESEIAFYTKSGILRASRRGEWIELDFPAEPPEPVEPSSELLAALGVEARYTGRNRMDEFVEVESEAVLRALAPDMARLARRGGRGVIVTCQASMPGYDFCSRFFAPAAGIDEDPVTGSAHCALGPYWGARLGLDTLVGYQASARGGVVRVRLGGERVYLGGQAVSVLRGELLT